MSTTDLQLAFDIRRSIILSAYMQYWGSPLSRVTMSFAGERVELYYFAGEDVDQVSRIATIGLSACYLDSGKRCDAELLLVVASSEADGHLSDIECYLQSIIQYLLHPATMLLASPIQAVSSESMIASSELENRPVSWPEALLLDLPGGEPEELQRFYVGTQAVNLYWALPIFDDEYQLIAKQGIDAFDQAVDARGINLVDVRRVSCVESKTPGQL
jgi:hypothetical protein